jgi:hypothetical protein
MPVQMIELEGAILVDLSDDVLEATVALVFTIDVTVNKPICSSC